jgi:hypothetical protein
MLLEELSMRSVSKCSSLINCDENWLSKHLGQIMALSGYLWHAHTHHHYTPVMMDSGTTQAIHVLENIKSKKIHLIQSEIEQINGIVSRGIVRGDRHSEWAKQLYDPS